MMLKKMLKAILSPLRSGSDLGAFRRYRLPVLAAADDAPMSVLMARYMTLAACAWIAATGAMFAMNLSLGFRPGPGSVAVVGFPKTDENDDVLAAANGQLEPLAEEWKEGPAVVLSAENRDGDYVVGARMSTISTPLDLILFSPGGGALLPSEIFHWICMSTFSISMPVSAGDVEKAYLLRSEDADGRPEEAKLAENAAKIRGAVERLLSGLEGRARLAQRLNGPIQFFTLWLFMLLLLAAVARWGCNVAPNERLRDMTELGPGKSAPWVVNRGDSRQLLEEYKLAFEWVCTNANCLGTNWTPAFLEVRRSAHAAVNLSGNYGEVPSFVSAQSSSLLDRLHSSASLLRYLIWAIPTVGFVGTVVGIGDALYLTRDMGSADEVLRSLARSAVSGSIGVAFDTTLVALLLSLVGMFVYNLLIEMEEGVILRAQKEALMGFLHETNRRTDQRDHDARLRYLEQQAALQRAPGGIPEPINQRPIQQALQRRSFRGLGCLFLIFISVVALIIAWRTGYLPQSLADMINAFNLQLQ